MKNCISSVLTARIIVPCEAPTRVNHTVTAIRHSVRRKISMLTEKNLRNSSVLKSLLISGRTGAYLTVMNETPTIIPIHWAVRVPQATPLICILNTMTSTRLTTILDILIINDIHIGVFASFIPSSHPDMT